MNRETPDIINFGLKKPIFIIGAPRSGTTFLGNLLSALPESEYFDKFLFTPHLAHCIASNNCKELNVFIKWFLVRDFADALGNRIHSRGLSLVSFLKGDIPILEMLYRKRKSISDVRMVYKEPFLTFIPQFIYETFQDCQVIHIIRDGRDVANSLIQSFNTFSDEVFVNVKAIKEQMYGEVAFSRSAKRGVVPWWVEKDREEEFLSTSQYHRCIWFWRIIVTRCLKEIESSKIINKSNYLSFRYENLCRKPKEISNKILKFLGIKPGFNYFRRLKRAIPGSIGKHKKFVNSSDIELAEQEAGRLLKKLGYLK